MTDAQRQQASNYKIAILVVALAFVFNFLGRGVGNTYMAFLVPLDREYEWTRTATASVYSFYMLASALAAPLVGVIFDRFGPRIVYRSGLIIMGCAYLLASHLTELWQLYLLVGVLSGISVSALGMIPASALIGRWYQKGTSTAIGIAYAGFGAGNLLIVPFSQYMISTEGWRAGYEVLGAILLICVPFTFLLPWNRIKAGSPDYQPAKAESDQSQKRTALLKAAMKTPDFWSLVAVVFFASFAVFVVMVQAIIFLVDHGFSATHAAAAFGITGMLSVFGMVSIGWLLHHFGNRNVVTFSFLLTFIGTVFIYILSYKHSPIILWLYVLTFGLSQGVRGPIVSVICTRLYAGSAHATIYGTISALGTLGSATGAWASGFLYDYSGEYRLGFMAGMVSVVLGAIPFLVNKKIANA